MESALAVRPAPDQGRAVFTNAVGLWQPVWAGGVFGGAILAQALAAAQHTVPAAFVAHSLQGTFVVAGNNASRFFYEVEAMRSGRSFATRLVRVWQSETCIATVVVSFAYTSAADDARVTLQHQPRVPPIVATARDLPSKDAENDDRSRLSPTCLAGDGCPLQCIRLHLAPGEVGQGSHNGRRQPRLGPGRERLYAWIRSRGHFERSSSHLAALAYLSDFYFLSTVQRVHHANYFNNRAAVKTILANYDDSRSHRDVMSRSEAHRIFEDLAEEEERENARYDPPGVSGPRAADERPDVDMMTSLSHTIYFHNPRALHADQWLLSEMDTPWAGDERGIVQQRIWTQDGILVATCIQEGVIRMRQHFTRSKL